MPVPPYPGLSIIQYGFELRISHVNGRSAIYVLNHHINKINMKTKSFQSGYVQGGELNSIIREIVLISDPEKILLLSATYDYLITENIYLKNTVQEFRGNHYNLLILSNDKEKKSLAKHKILLYCLSKDRRNLQLQVLDISEFNNDLMSGKEYANHIVSNAMIWYDKGEVPLAFPKN